LVCGINTTDAFDSSGDIKQSERLLVMQKETKLKDTESIPLVKKKNRTVKGNMKTEDRFDLLELAIYRIEKKLGMETGKGFDLNEDDEKIVHAILSVKVPENSECETKRNFITIPSTDSWYLYAQDLVERGVLNRFTGYSFCVSDKYLDSLKRK